MTVSTVDRIGVTLGRIICKRDKRDLENPLITFAATLMTKWDAENDAKLVSCMANGTTEERQQAFDAFYRRHATYLYGICYNPVNRYKFGFFSEEDVFQSTMAKARDHASTFRAPGTTDPQELEDAVDAWLGGIATRVVLDFIRRKPNSVCLDPDLRSDDEEEEDETFIEKDEPGAADETEEMKLLREAIDSLSAREQEVIWAVSQFYVRREHQRTPTEDLDEIIGSLGISRDNFRKIKQRARTKILVYMSKRKPVPEAK